MIKTVLLWVDTPAENGAVCPPWGEDEAAVEGTDQLGDPPWVADHRQAAVGVSIQGENLEPNLEGIRLYQNKTIKKMMDYQKVLWFKVYSNWTNKWDYSGSVAYLFFSTESNM